MIFDCRHHHDESSFSAIMGNCFLDTMDTMDRMGVQWGYIYILYILNGYNNIRITWDMTTNTNQSICAMVKTSVFFAKKMGVVQKSIHKDSYTHDVSIPILGWETIPHSHVLTLQPEGCDSACHWVSSSCPASPPKGH